MGGDAQRDNNYDLLRLLSCIAVILLHSNWEYWGSIAYTRTNTINWYFGSIINIITRFSVPCFAMLTGAFLMNSPVVMESIKEKKSLNVMKIYKNVSFKIFIPTIIALGIQVVIDIISKIINHENPISFIKYVFTGAYANLWYIYMLFFLYLLVPVIVLIKRHVTNRHYVILTLFMMLWAIGSQATSDQHLLWSIGVVIPFTAYFAMGDIIYSAIKDGKIKKTWRNKLLLIVISMACILVTLFVRMKGFTYYLVKSNVNFFSPTIVIFSACVFCLFGLLEIKKPFFALSSYTFVIYLWHMFVMRLIEPLLGSLSMVTSICVLCVSTFILSLAVAIVFSKIWTFACRKFGLRNRWYNSKMWERVFDNQGQQKANGE